MSALPQRKEPRLHGYDYCAAGAYFITICARNRRCLFGSISPTDVGGDACIAPQVALTPLGNIVQKHLANIPGVTEFVVMPNHLHCLIVVPAHTAAGGPMQASAPTAKVETISQRIRVFKGHVSHEAGAGVFSVPFMTISFATRTNIVRFANTSKIIQPDGPSINSTQRGNDP